MNSSISTDEALRIHVEETIREVMAELPDPAALSSDARRDIIARYAAVLEGNFIYWMTAAYLAVSSEGAKHIIRANLLEEVRDNHPSMMRRFAVAARAVPNDHDLRAVDAEVHAVRRFLARLHGACVLPMMACFEGFIAQFMPYLADLARRRQSTDFEYATVHASCDVGHTAELFAALREELRLSRGTPPSVDDMMEGVRLLRSLLVAIVRPRLAFAAQPG